MPARLLSPGDPELGDFSDMIQRFFPAVALLIVLGSCGPSGTYEIAPVSLSLTATSQQTVAAAVIDQRPYVLNGDESPNFLGTERGNWGGEKTMSTESGRDLADDLTDAVVRALADRGIAASALQPVKGIGEPETLAAFRAQGADRLLVVAIQDWRTDVYTRVKLSWRLEASVHDRAGNLLAQTTSQGATPVASSDLTAKYAPIAVGELSRKLSDLLNERVITEALR
jgi:hypothetical protein